MGRDARALRSRLLPRQRAGLAAHAVAGVALVPVFVVVAPRSSWGDPWLLVVLGVLAVIAERSRVPLPSGVSFEGLIALMLVAVALAGPLPAMEIVILPWLANGLTGDRRFLRAGALANLVGYGWQAITAAVLLEAAGVRDPTSPGALGWLVAAGLVLYVVGWAGGPAIYAPLWLGQPFRAVAHALVDMLPAALVMIVLGALTVVLTGPLGLLALVVFAVVAVLPQSWLTFAARTRPAARLDQATAARRYAHAIAIQLGLSRRERRHVRRVAAAAQRLPATGEAIDYVTATLHDPSLATADAQLAVEWWNGAGGPLGLRAVEIPLAARVVAVAHTWSALTARGTPQLGHYEALDSLRRVAGARLDPAVVRAARAVIEQELVTAEEPAPEPRLHRLGVPAPLRRALTAAAKPGELLGR